MKAFLDRFEPFLRLAYRVAVVASLLAAVAEIRQLNRSTPDLSDLEAITKSVSRDVAAIRDRVNPEPSASHDPCMFTPNSDQCSAQKAAVEKFRKQLQDLR